MREELRIGRPWLLALSLLLTLPGCSSSGKTTQLTERDNGATVAVEVGEEILIALHNPTPGDLASPSGWPSPTLSSDCVEFLGAGISTDGESGLPNATVYQFEARRTGSTTISIPAEDSPFAVNIYVM